MNIQSALRRAVVLGAPLGTAVLELFHPKVPTATLVQDPGVNATWLTVHVLQLFMFGLVALAVILLLDRQETGIAEISRLAMGGFAVIYGAYDALAGIATGLLASQGQSLSGGQQAAMISVARQYFDSVENGSFGWIGNLGTFFWVAGVLVAAVALARPRLMGSALALALLTAAMLALGNQMTWHILKYAAAAVLLITLAATAYGSRIPLGALALLGLSAIALTSGHPAPFGTLSFGSLFAAALWLEFARRPSPVREARLAS